MSTRTLVADPPAHASDTASHSGPKRSPLLLRMNFTDPRSAVLAVSGELDAATAPQLAELLWPRLMTTLSAIALDLSKLTFLGVAGMEILVSAHNYAGQRGITFTIINSTRTVDRALAAGGLDVALPCFATVADAHADHASRARRPAHTS